MTKDNPDVIIIGGGMAGLSAAHNLAKNGLSVTVYEQADDLGGKMRSYYDSSGIYEGEHGFRLFTKRYSNCFDLFDEINVRNNLSHIGFNYFMAGKKVGVLPGISNFKGFLQFLHGLALKIHFFGAKGTQEYMQIMNKFMAIKHIPKDDLHKMDDQTIAEYISLKKYSPLIQKYFSRMTRFTNAVNINEGSMASMAQQINVLFKAALSFSGKPYIFYLNGPTSNKFIYVWEKYLAHLNITIHKNTAVKKINFNASSQIDSIELANKTKVSAKCYIVATPMDEASKLTENRINIDKIKNSQKIFSGIQFHLQNTAKNILPSSANFFFLFDSPWEISCIRQDKKRWPDHVFENKVDSILSIILTCWTQNGLQHLKKPLECNKEELINEIIYQFNQSKIFHLDPDSIIKTHIDPTLNYDEKKKHFTGSSSMLYCPQTGEYKYRPENTTVVPNLFVCGDYTKTAYQITSMESANESGRRAAKAVLQFLGENGDKVIIHS